MRRALAVGALLLLVVTTGCANTATEGATDSTSTTATSLTRPVAFDTWKETFVDRSRPTEAGSQTPAAPERTLETTIYLPDGTDSRPLIVFSHGLGGHPDKFSDLLSAWARAGYVVAAPAFPTTNDHVVGASQNYTVASGQPADVSFVLDQVLALANDPGSRLHDRIDVDHIGAGGLSLGGGTTYAVVFSRCCRDPRFTAAEVLAGALFPLAGEMDLDGHVPLLIAHGDADPVLDHHFAEDAFARAAAPVWFVTLLGASHAPPFENDVTPYDHAAEQFTTDFWDATIGGDPSAWERFDTDAAVPGLTTLQQK
jgi:dienelactone hydrolase